jgi:hypothetical protein
MAKRTTSTSAFIVVLYSLKPFRGSSRRFKIFVAIFPTEKILDMIIIILGFMKTGQLFTMCAAVPAFSRGKSGILDNPLKMTDRHYYFEETGH